MTDDEITLPPLTDEQCVELAREAGLDWHQGFPVGGEEENRYAVMCRAAVMLDRQQRAAPSAKPVAWMYDCGGGGRMYADELSDSTGWLPLYTSPPAPSAERDTRPCWGVPHAGMIRCLDAAIDRLHAGDTPEEVFADFGWSLTVPPDHFAVMRQALDALEERYIGALRDNAIDALRAALERK